MITAGDGPGWPVIVYRALAGPRPRSPLLWLVVSRRLGGPAKIERAYQANRRYDMLVTTSCFGAGMATATLVPQIVEHRPSVAIACAIGGVAAITTGQQNYAGTETGRAMTALGIGLLVGRLVKHLKASYSSGAKVQRTR